MEKRPIVDIMQNPSVNPVTKEKVHGGLFWYKRMIYSEIGASAKMPLSEEEAIT